MPLPPRTARPPPWHAFPLQPRAPALPPASPSPCPTSIFFPACFNPPPAPLYVPRFLPQLKPEMRVPWDLLLRFLPINSCSQSVRQSVIESLFLSLATVLLFKAQTCNVGPPPLILLICVCPVDVYFFAAVVPNAGTSYLNSPYVLLVTVVSV